MENKAGLTGQTVPGDGKSPRPFGWPYPGRPEELAETQAEPGWAKG